MKIATILDQIDIGAMALPEFQRGYVWNRAQVKGLVQSLYRRYPVGGLLVWVTKTEGANVKGDNKLAPGSVELLLDGQQRITSLYGLIRGNPPKFFEGNKEAFTNLYFNLEEEEFEFYASLKMKGNPLWINVTELLQKGSGEFISKLATDPQFIPNLSKYINRLTAIDNIKNIDLHVEQVTGEDKTVDVVVDIFNRVNSGGTKLSKGDLALAKICAEWPDARDELKKRLNKWAVAGFYFRMDWLLRCVNTVTTGEALFSALDTKVDNISQVKDGLKNAENAIDNLLNLISARLGLDHDDVLSSRYSFPVLARFLFLKGGVLADYKERDKLLYWYIHTLLWGRYAGSTESVLNQDLALLNPLEGALDRLIEQLRKERRDLRLNSRDFITWSTSSRFYPLLYMMTRVWHAKDWGSGLEMSSHLLGNLNRLQVHHIFPKALLYKNGYSRAEVNTLANYTFLTQVSNLKISDRDPADYLPEIVNRHPGVLESCWIPMDKELWQVNRYRDFVSARRELLAKAANEFLDTLFNGYVPEMPVTISILDRVMPVVPGSVADDEEAKVLRECNEWVLSKQLSEGEIRYELVDPQTNQQLANLDIAWPRGLQEGLSEPVTLLIDEPNEVEEIANRFGYKFFTSVESFKEYVEQKILAVETIR
ncbi:MAG: DUF262 domain-containing protein [Chloroflexi bacterium]|uniref:DUF262 domain-containing protein n=1 Tax=Candidatus Chlorohelix allophototropha TaxID=3003348 RepID=A0A8T7M6R1_9CHLR|nr:DUF262 domain-containing protein [Chloroflexota bacterium]WJW69684.1 DUF262 domain-containing protein [Chloroflexota bacterium L227-S17]